MSRAGRQAARSKRVALALGWRTPFFLPGVARCEIREGTCVSACVHASGLIEVNPKFAEPLTDDELAGVMAHEVCHLLLMHGDRRGDREHRLWNIANDMVINHGLRLAGIALPAGALYPTAGMEEATSEEMYEHLRKESEAQQQQPKSGNGSGGSGQGNSKLPESQQSSQGNDQSNGGGGDLATPGQGNSQGTGDSEGSGDREQGNGSGGGSPEPQPIVGQGCGVVQDDDEKPTQDQQREWAYAAAQARAMAAQAGSEAGRALPRLLDFQPPRVKWDRLLRMTCQQAVAAHGRDDQTWRKRGRRSPADGPQFPGWQATSPKVGVLIDTSGSVGDDDLEQAVSETISVSRATGVKIYLVTHDAEVQWAGWLQPGIRVGQVKDAVRGRGGTLFGPAYRKLEEAGRLDAVVHLTDGIPCDKWPDLPPKARRLIVALVGSQCETALPVGARKVLVEKPARRRAA